MANRRSFLQSLSSLPLIGGFLGAAPSARAAGKSSRDFFKELGVRPFINAAGTYTSMTASLMPTEVVEAYNYASEHYVMLDELHDAVGARIASLIGSEAAMVTAGAASALTLGTAGVLTGKNTSLIRQLPDLAGMKSEVIMQRTHRFGYDHAVRNCGIRIVEIGTREDLERAVNPETALMLFFNDAEPRGQIQAQEWADLGKKYGVPTFNDCAADVPPLENLSKYLKMGFDLVTFSGGKGIRGPQSAGLLLGRKDLIEAARLNAPPNGDAIGRGMKVNKEELLGMMVAVERFLKRDHEADMREWRKRADQIAKSASAVKGVESEVYVPPIANHVPHIRISWDAAKLGLSPREAVRALREGEPSIAVMSHEAGLQVGVWMMRDGEHEIVARRIGEVLRKKA